MAELKVKLIEYTPNPEKVIAMAAKLCYSPTDIDSLAEKQTPQIVEAFLNKLIDIGHMSPVEHVSFTFAIEEVSRITEIQLVRHRLASYSIQSGRYVNRNNPSFVIPPSIKASRIALEVYEDVMNKSMKAYNDLFLILMLKQMGYTDEFIDAHDDDERINLVSKLHQEDKILYSKYEKNAIEDARYAHLQSISTRIIMTMNVRELLHFFKHRCCNRAQWEIRELALKLLTICQQVSPTLFKNCGPSCVNGKCSEGRMSCGNIPIEFKKVANKGV